MLLATVLVVLPLHSVLAADTLEGRTITVKLKLPEVMQSSGDSLGELAISRVVDNRVVTQNSRSKPVASNRIIAGWESKYRPYDVLLKKQDDVEDVVRQIAIKSFESVGYKIVSQSTAQTNGVPTVDVYVDEFWVDVEKIPSSGRSAFTFNIALRFVSEDEKLGAIGVVRTTGTLNGNRSKHASSYRNTVFYTLKSFYPEFGSRYRDAGKAEPAVQPSGSALVQDLTNAKALFDAGAITAEEYTLLKSKILSNE